MRKLGLALVLAVICAAALGAVRADASPVRALHQTSWIRYCNGSRRRAGDVRLKSMGVGIVRFTLRWDEVAAVRPSNARKPGATRSTCGAPMTRSSARSTHKAPLSW